MAEFFENSTPRQMLEKAKREYQKLTESLDSDNIFNFFVTAYHVVDHVKKLVTIPKEAMNRIYLNPDFKKCKYICNKSKHRVLSKDDDEFITYRRPAATLGEFTLGESALGIGRAYFIIDGTEQVDVLELGQRIIDLWETFFKKHNI